ncbi:MAG: HmuY family protein [Labilithrix sp.]|nr:HmuY family protein [Labilithrix sp.]
MKWVLDWQAIAGASLAVATSLAACSDSAGTSTPAPGADAGDDAAVSFDSGTELRVALGGGRVHVKLSDPPAVVTPADPATDKGWDIAFQGLDVFTNSGPSGGGNGAAFGPLDAIVFLEDIAPTVPFLSPDTTGGAFIRWWFYGGAPDHALYSRYHTYGIKDGDKLFKLQVLNYYGQRDGAPISALYKVRWAEVLAGGASGQVMEAADLDGTAGGPQGKPDAPIECLDLGTGARQMLAPSVARTVSTWHVCFRRQDISVNGEIGGPRGVGAVDLDADKSPTETFEDIRTRSDQSERARFDAVDDQALAGHAFRGDRVVSAFGTLWLQRGVSPPAPARTAWLVVGADGTSKYLLGFARFEGATAESAGTIVMRIKPVK